MFNSFFAPFVVNFIKKRIEVRTYIKVILILSYCSWSCWSMPPQQLQHWVACIFPIGWWKSQWKVSRHQLWSRKKGKAQPLPWLHGKIQQIYSKGLTSLIQIGHTRLVSYTMPIEIRNKIKCWCITTHASLFNCWIYCIISKAIMCVINNNYFMTIVLSRILGSYEAIYRAG